MHTIMGLTHGGEYGNARFPCTEKELQILTDSFELSNTADTKVKIHTVYDNDTLDVLLSGSEQNLDELNYLMKRLESFEQWESDTFHAAAFSQRLTSAGDMINLTFNIHCYSLLTGFSDLNRLGRDMCLRARGAIAPEDFWEFDGKKYLEEIMETYPSPTVTPYGILYENENRPELVYNGRTFPAYWHKENPITLEISTGRDKEYLYLPVEKNEITKALERLGADGIESAQIRIEEHSLPENLAKIIFADQDIDTLNQFAAHFIGMDNDAVSELSNLSAFAKITEPGELDTLIGCMYEFDCFPNVHTAEQYGRYMICESGHFEFDDNLEEYINFRAYGEDKASRETGVFTDKGYLLYHGYSMEMQNILHKNIGFKIKEPQERTEFKLYMPLRAVTYEDENVYGDLVPVDIEIEVCPSELAEHEAAIRTAIQHHQRDNGCRGMMKYYGEADTVSAKVQRYIFDVEEVQGRLMGVAVLTLNAPLDDSEMAAIKNEILGQASDGFGEGFEQCEINCGGRDVCVSLWRTEKWTLQTEDEFILSNQTQEMGGDFEQCLNREALGMNMEMK